MAMYYAIGDALVTEGELREKQAEGSLKSFRKSLEKNRNAAVLEFSTGQLTAENMRESFPLPSGETTKFEPIGPGKPLTIEIRHLYTGVYPHPSFFDKTKDLLVTSALKSLATFDAAPRAINFITKNIRSGYNLKSAAATEQGTPLIHYTPALTENNTVLTLEMGFDEFPDEIFTLVQGALTQAAGIPLFVSASSYLLAAGAITKLLGDIGSRLFDSPPVFKATEPLTFLRPGDAPPEADFRLCISNDTPVSLLEKYKVGPGGQLVDSEGKPYNGETPYIMCSLDGRKMDEYANFTPTAASAALLEKFYSIKEGQEQPLGPLMDAVKLYNDWKFRKKADTLATELRTLKPDSKDFKEKKGAYDAAVANIMDDLLKPKEKLG